MRRCASGRTRKGNARAHVQRTEHKACEDADPVRDKPCLSGKPKGRRLARRRPAAEHEPHLCVLRPCFGGESANAGPVDLRRMRLRGTRRCGRRGPCFLSPSRRSGACPRNALAPAARAGSPGEPQSRPESVSSRLLPSQCKSSGSAGGIHIRDGNNAGYPTSKRSRCVRRHVMSQWKIAERQAPPRKNRLSS